MITEAIKWFEADKIEGRVGGSRVRYGFSRARRRREESAGDVVPLPSLFGGGSPSDGASECCVP